MNGLYELNQTSGYDWSPREGSRLYHRQRAVPPQPPTIQLSELAGLEAQMAQYQNEHRKLIGAVRSLYVFQDEALVTEYLERHRSLPPLLAEAERHLRQFFKDSVLSLSATSDEHGWDMLYAFVHWSGEPDVAIDALHRFDESWWLANSYPAGSSLTFTYRLV